jgi:hypothetical protein
VFYIVGGTRNIIRAEGVPSGKLSVFITMDTLARFAGGQEPAALILEHCIGHRYLEEVSWSLLASKPVSFLASAEVPRCTWYAAGWAASAV